MGNSAATVSSTRCQSLEAAAQKEPDPAELTVAAKAVGVAASSPLAVLERAQDLRFSRFGPPSLQACSCACIFALCRMKRAATRYDACGTRRDTSSPEQRPRQSATSIGQCAPSP